MLRHRSGGGTRRGVGALPLVLVMALVMLGLLAAHAMLAGSTARNVRRLAAGERTARVAEMAVAAAHFQLGRAVNDRSVDADLWEAFRTTAGPFQRELPLAKLPGVLRDELALSPGLSLDDDMVALDCHFQARSSVAAPSDTDRYGLVTLSATAVDGGEGVTRRVEQSFDVTVALATTPRPFDQETFLCGDADELVNTRRLTKTANQVMDEAATHIKTVRSNATAIKGKYEEIKTKLEGMGDEAKQYVEEVTKAIAVVTTMLSSCPAEVTLVDAGGAAADRSVARFPAPPFAISTRAAEVDLATLDLPAKVVPRVVKMGEAVQTETTAREALRTLYTTLASSQTPDASKMAELTKLTQAWCTAALALATECDGLLLTDYKGFQGAVTITSGSEYGALKPALASLGLSDTYRRSSLTVPEGDPWRLGDTRPIGEKFSSLLDQDGISCGALFVDNPSQKLDVGRAVPGRMVVAVRGDLELSTVPLEAEGTDLTVFITTGTTTVSGQVAASVVAAGPLKMGEGAKVRGPLIMVRYDGAAPSGEVFRGLVTRDERYLAGADTVTPSRLIVSLAPYPVRRALAW